jgi:glycosyltransferase involved in cell wall biosynthesis
MHDRSLAERLADHVPVLYVDPPISPATPSRRPDVEAPGWPRVRRVTDSLAQLSPVVLPGLRRPYVAAANARIVRHQIRTAVRALGAPVEAAIDSDVLLASFGGVRERVRVYWAQDDYAGGAALLGLDPVRLRVAEARLAARADLVIAASEVVERKLAALGAEPVLIPYGCDPQAYASVDEADVPGDVRLPAPVAGLVGHINSRIDLSLLEGVADAGHSLLLVGPIEESFEPARVKALLARTNVVWVGKKPAESLPGYLRVIDVGLVPYADTPFNRASFPLKTLEYLAAGRAVVSTDLPATRWLNTPLIDVVASEGTGNAVAGADFAAAVTASLAKGRSGSVVDERRAFAGLHSWARRAEAFAAAIDAAGGRATRNGGPTR